MKRTCVGFALWNLQEVASSPLSDPRSAHRNCASPKLRRAPKLLRAPKLRRAPKHFWLPFEDPTCGRKGGGESGRGEGGEGRAPPPPAWSLATRLHPRAGLNCNRRPARPVAGSLLRPVTQVRASKRTSDESRGRGPTRDSPARSGLPGRKGAGHGGAAWSFVRVSEERGAGTRLVGCERACAHAHGVCVGMHVFLRA